MITLPNTSQDLDAAYAEVRKVESATLMKQTHTSTALSPSVVIEIAPPWSDSLPREYLSNDELKKCLKDYKSAEPASTPTTAYVDYVFVPQNDRIILDSSDIIINVDSEIRSAQFSKEHPIEVMFPGITEEMNRILGD